jgi:hypothetical protein
MLTDDLLAAEENVENMEINTGERTHSNGKPVLLIKGGRGYSNVNMSTPSQLDLEISMLLNIPL